MSSENKNQPEVVLWIGGYYSQCGRCTQNADPYEKAHLMADPAWHDTGCGAVYTHVAAQYPGMDERVAEMRPDLILSSLHTLL